MSSAKHKPGERHCEEREIFQSRFLKLILAAKNNLEFDHNDFQSDVEISDLFRAFFLLKKELLHDVIYVFNRESDCNDHNLLELLKGRNLKIKYYTKNFETENSKRPISNEIHKSNLRSLKKLFGKNIEY